MIVADWAGCGDGCGVRRHRHVLCLFSLLLALSSARCAAVGHRGGVQDSAENRAPPPTLLSRMFELEPATEHDRFRFRPHRTIYFLPARYSSEPGELPASPQHPNPGPPVDLDPIEVKFQLSAKMKVMDGMITERANLWLAYSQQNNWQFYQQSSPFRETNYEPEAFAVLRTDIALGPVNWRTTGLGLLHQSNGRDGEFSRSWNRLYAQFGVEVRQLTLFLRPWFRIPESGREDDNGDIEDFYGYGDLTAMLEHRNWLLTTVLRNNLDLDQNRGALELSLQAPLPGVQRARVFAQYFNGFGESLIDYNHRQQTFGIGISLTDWATN